MLSSLSLGKTYKTSVMKMKVLIAHFSLSFLCGFPVLSQETETSAKARKTMAILSMDSEISNLSAQKAGDILRLEAEKLGIYEIMDKYDVKYLVEQNNINVDNCFGKICLVDAGKSLKVETMLTGNIEVYANGMNITLRLIDVGQERIIKTVTKEYTKNSNYIQTMIEIALKDLLDIENNAAVEEAIRKKVTVPVVHDPSKDIPRLRSDGPRMGVTMLTGEAASIFQRPTSEGGYDALPVMFQFGYQFETTYLSSGNFQALFEFLPMITGLDQGLFIPSFTLLNGLRFNKQGFEFAFGPTASLGQKEYGYYDADGEWRLQSYWNETEEDPIANPNPFPIVKRIDSRGHYTLVPGFLFAAGYTIRSGNLNMPINAFVIPNRHGVRFGLSLGFNATKRN